MMKQPILSNIYVKKEVLPYNPQYAYDAIYNHFDGFDVNITDDKNCFIISLKKSDFSYCEDLTRGLEDLMIPFESISNYCYSTSNSCVCLSENWLPYGWQCISQSDFDNEKTAIIHIDDHSDLMSPFISYGEKKYKNLLSGEISDIHDLHFLKNAVDTGAITIGSMLTMIVYSLKSCNIYHLKRQAKQIYRGMERITIPDVLLNADRIGIDLIEPSKGDTYLLTTSIQDIQSRLLDEKQCILHIDMDYFNNRYNGSTSWKTDGLSRDYHFEEQKQRMIEICETLKAINAIIPIKYVLIGLSPSFYPAEYWAKGLSYLLGNLKDANIDVDALIDHFEFGVDT